MKILLLTAILLQGINTFAQVATGLYEDNYTASTAMLVNPAAPFADPNQWEVNLASAGFFIDNNYIYYDHQTVFSVINYFQSNYHNGQNMSFFNNSSVHLNGEGFVQGPSFYYCKNGVSFGIFMDERGGVSIESSSAPQNLYNLFTVPFNQLITIPVTHAAFMNWAEFGVNGALQVGNFTTGKLYVGADVKFLGGLNAKEYDNNQAFSFERHSDSTVTATPVNMNYAYSQNGSNSLTSILLGFKGAGLGGDIGGIYIIGNRVSCNQLYNWKFGASVNDIGAIAFNSSSSDFQLTSQGTKFSDNAFVHATTQQALDQTLSQVVYDGANTSFAANTFTIWLPMSFTLQADKAIGNGFYIDASILRRVAILNNMIYSPNIEALTPRYESKWFTVAIPLSLYNETDFHFGLSLRFGPLTVGSDDLESLLIPGELAGTDVYVGLRISLFKSGCEKPKAAKKPGKYLECPPEPMF